MTATGTASRGAARPGSRRSAAVLLAVVVGALVVSYAIGRPDPARPPLDPRSDQPDGASALVALARALDVDVRLATGLPDETDDAALVLVDRLDDAQRTDLLAWVRRGGRLVVADPTSPLADPRSTAPVTVDEVQPGACSVDALEGLGPIEPGMLLELVVPAGAWSCYGDGDVAFVVVEERGAGVVVTLGSPGGLVNDTLGDGDNAPLAAALIAPVPGETVRVVDPPAPVGGDEGLYDLVAPGVRRALVQLGIAFVVYAAWRALRLGRPVVEAQPVPIAGSELVGATGRLLQSTRAPDAAAEALRADLRRALASRIGLPADTPPERLATAVEQRHGTDPALLQAALAPTPVTTEDQLVTVARAVAAMRQELLP